MVRARESLTPLAEGPPSFNERQVTPGQLLDMRLGYLSNMGAEVELVTTETGRVVPVTIAAVGRSFWIDQKPDGSRLIPEDEIRTSPAWTDCPYVTFYTRNPEGGTLAYEQLRYSDLGLAPVRDGDYRILGWDPDPIWYLRWPAEAEAN